MTMLRHACWRLLLLAMPLAGGSALADDASRLVLDEVVGDYEQVSPRCFEKIEGVVHPCEHPTKDRMVIEKVDDETARLVIDSHQENYHECHADGVARLTPSGLQHCLDYEPGTCLTLVRDADRLVLQVSVEGARYVPFCGSRATLDGLAFPLSARLDPRRCQSQQR